MSSHPHPNESRLDGCPYCETDMADEAVAGHLPDCDAGPSTDEVVAALRERGVLP